MLRNPFNFFITNDKYQREIEEKKERMREED